MIYRTFSYRVRYIMRPMSPTRFSLLKQHRRQGARHIAGRRGRQTENGGRRQATPMAVFHIVAMT